MPIPRERLSIADDQHVGDGKPRRQQTEGGIMNAVADCPRPLSVRGFSA